MLYHVKQQKLNITDKAKKYETRLYFTIKMKIGIENFQLLFQ